MVFLFGRVMVFWLCFFKNLFNLVFKVYIRDIEKIGVLVDLWWDLRGLKYGEDSDDLYEFLFY